MKIFIMSLAKFDLLLKVCLLISILSGCSSTPVNTSTNTNQATANNSATKTFQPPTLNSAQIELLNTNGYSNGIWSTNCSSIKYSKEIISQFENKFTIATFDEVKRTSYEFIYDVSQVSKGVILVKTKQHIF